MKPNADAAGSATDPVTVYIGIGSNLLHPVEQVRQALANLAAMPGSHLLRHSPLYRSTPMGPVDQPDYINAVAVLATTLTPLDLLDALQKIEQRQGRVRGGQRWGPRTLDLDILLYGEQQIVTDRLTVPHPGLGERNFVLYPLADVADDKLYIPGLGLLGQLIRACSRQGLELLQQC